MEQLSIQQTTEYLRHVAELELLIYKQEKIIKEARRSIPTKKVSQKKIQCPVDTSEHIEKPERRERVPVLDTVVLIPAGFLAVFVVLLFVFVNGYNSYRSGLYHSTTAIVFCVLCSLFALLMLIILITLIKSVIKRNSTIEADYQRDIMEYEKKKKAEKKRYEKQYSAYLKKKDELEQENRKTDREARACRKNVEKEIARMEKPLEEAKVLLEQLYSKNIVFEKYRNIVAMCTMFEYFQSGRCSELTGPDGAYNLYEAELRQNIIINQLEKVTSDLERIQANQHLLYNGLKELNMSLDSIRTEINYIANTVDKIEESSRVTAICAEITAKNTAALAYITLLKK